MCSSDLLNLSRRFRRQNPPERRRIVEVAFRQPKVRVIEEIENLHTKLQRLFVVQSDVSHERQIQVAQAGPNQNISSGVSKSIALRNGEGVGVEESLRSGIVQFWAADDIGPVMSEEPSHISRIAIIGRQSWRKWPSRLKCQNAADLPASQQSSHPSVLRRPSSAATEG